MIVFQAYSLPHLTYPLAPPWIVAPVTIRRVWRCSVSQTPIAWPETLSDSYQMAAIFAYGALAFASKRHRHRPRCRPSRSCGRLAEYRRSGCCCTLIPPTSSHGRRVPGPRQEAPGSGLPRPRKKAAARFGSERSDGSSRYGETVAAGARQRLASLRRSGCCSRLHQPAAAVRLGRKAARFEPIGDERWRRCCGRECRHHRRRRGQCERCHRCRRERYCGCQ